MRSKYEIRAYKELQSQGYTVDYKIRPRINPRGYKVDYFGLFDIIAHKPGEAIRWISIKGLAGNRHINKREIIAFSLSVGNQAELWHVNTKGEWIKEIIWQDGQLHTSVVNQLNSAKKLHKPTEAHHEH